MINRISIWRWGELVGYRQHINTSDTSQGLLPLPLQDHLTFTQNLLHAATPLLDLMKNKAHIQKQVVNMNVLHKKKKTKRRGTKEGTRRHPSSSLFVQGAQQTLRWQIALCTTWANVDSGHFSIMTFPNRTCKHSQLSVSRRVKIRWNGKEVKREASCLA